MNICKIQYGNFSSFHDFLCPTNVVPSIFGSPLSQLYNFKNQNMCLHFMFLYAIFFGFFGLTRLLTSLGRLPEARGL